MAKSKAVIILVAKHFQCSVKSVFILFYFILFTKEECDTN